MAGYIYANDLAERWLLLWRRLGVTGSGALEQAGTDIIAAYRNPLRFYHDITHLHDVLQKLDWSRSQMEASGETALLGPVREKRVFDEVELALWYHDAVYDATAKDNEAQSRDWFLRDAAKFGLDEKTASNVARLIGLTAHHGRANGFDECLMSDIDLSILGAGDDQFRAYDADIRKEYAHVPAPAYKIGRRKVLEGFLKQPQIFKTRVFAGQYEAAARRNLSRALDDGFLPRLKRKVLGLFGK